MSVTRDPSRVAAPPRSGFRPDVQGLRALAVSLVVVYHLFPGVLGGGYVGVDVFFVISGFLITGHLLRTVQRTGRVGFVDFYARRARRLLPAAALVLAVTWVVSRLVLPVTQLADTATQIRASALYFQNWALAHDAVSYLKSDDAATPVQHFWSLSVEEQFYLGWPLLVLVSVGLATLVSRRRGAHGRRHRMAVDRDPRRVLLALASLVVVASLWYSIADTAGNPAAAYFVTPTRVWELGLGGVLALLGEKVSWRVGRVGALAWIGLGMIAWSALRLTGQTAFPGAIALVPVIGAVLVIAAGSPRGKLGPSRLLSARPVVFLGDISYSIYLWHWPMIVLWRSYTGRPIGLFDAVAIVLASVLLAWLTKKLVEDPFRVTRIFAGHKWRSLATVLVTAIPVVLVSVWISAQPQPGQYKPRQALASHPGSAVLAGSAKNTPAGSNAPLVPPLATVATDFEASSNDNCQAGINAVTPTQCTFGTKDAPSMTVALVGDSVAGEWSSALAAIANKHHWKLVTMTHSSCPWTAITVTRAGSHKPYTACQQWGRKITSRLLSMKPDVVITSDRPTSGVPSKPKSTPSTRRAVGAGMATYWKKLEAAGVPVIGIQETPEMGRDIPTCLAARGGSTTNCSTPAKRAVYRSTAVQTAAHDVPAAKWIDMNPLICGPAVCSPTVGNVIVYRDAHHLTKTYTLSLQPYLERKLLATGDFGHH